MLLLSAGALVALISGNQRTRVVSRRRARRAVGCRLCAQRRRNGRTPSGKPVGVAIVQGAIPQDEKAQGRSRARGRVQDRSAFIASLAESAFGTPVIVFPEASLPPIANEIVDYLRALFTDAAKQRLRRSSSASCARTATTVRDGYKDYYNSVLALDRKVPSRAVVRQESSRALHRSLSCAGLRAHVDGPDEPAATRTSRAGAAVQPPLRAAGLNLSASICYEDGYGSSQLPVLENADTLVNVTNDAWFGHGSARYLHFQIARMRAIEAQRYMIRAGNDGISAVIGPRGEIVAEAPGFVRHVLRSEVTPRMGLPPYARVGNWLDHFARRRSASCCGVWLAAPRTVTKAAVQAVKGTELLGRLPCGFPTAPQRRNL